MGVEYQEKVVEGVTAGLKLLHDNEYAFMDLHHSNVVWVPKPGGGTAEGRAMLVDFESMTRFGEDTTNTPVHGVERKFSMADAAVDVADLQLLVSFLRGAES